MKVLHPCAAEVMAELLFEDPCDHKFGFIDLLSLVLQLVFGQTALWRTAVGELNQAIRRVLDGQDDVYQPGGNRICGHAGLDRLRAIRTPEPR